MIDAELLDLAAKAMGLKYMNGALWDGRDVVEYSWNPLEDDGHALRLAVMLKIDLTFHRPQVYAHKAQPSVFVGEAYLNDLCAATRRAIVRAATEIGKGMQ